MVAEAVTVECQIVLPAVAFIAQYELDVVGTLFAEVLVADFKGVDSDVFAVCIQFLRWRRAFLMGGGQAELVVWCEIPVARRCKRAGGLTVRTEAG